MCGIMHTQGRACQRQSEDINILQIVVQRLHELTLLKTPLLSGHLEKSLGKIGATTLP